MRSIAESGNLTTDQDIWECFYDLAAIYIDDPLSTSFRAFRPQLSEWEALWGSSLNYFYAYWWSISNFTSESPVLKGQEGVDGSSI